MRQGTSEGRWGSSLWPSLAGNDCLSQAVLTHLTLKIWAAMHRPMLTRHEFGKLGIGSSAAAEAKLFQEEGPRDSIAARPLALHIVSQV